MTDQELRSRGKSPSGSATEIPREAPADQCCISLNDSMKQLWIGLANNDLNSVEYSRLSPKDKCTFDAARKKEIDGLLDLKAYRILSLEESLAFRREHPDCVLPSRWVDRWKPTDEGGHMAKSRIVILGFKDPHVLQLVRSAPTPTHEAFTTCLQICASRRWAANSSDIKNAFWTIKKN